MVLNLDANEDGNDAQGRRALSDTWAPLMLPAQSPPKLTFDQAVSYLREVSAADVDRMVTQYAQESGVTREQWLAKCTVDVSFRVVKGILGEEVVWECKARKR